MVYLILYAVVLNAVTGLLFGIDKWKARHHWWRIPERTLLGLALLGGSWGAWGAMKCFHHKTLHKKFSTGIPLICIFQLIGAVYVIVEYLSKK